MRVCEAPNCRNSTRNGHILRRFPKSPTRRRKWIKNLGRKGWTPTQSSSLCDEHFSPEMWENPKIFGKTKLKQTAIPTIFHRPPIIFPLNVVEREFNQSILKTDMREPHVNTGCSFANTACEHPEGMNKEQVGGILKCTDNTIHQDLESDVNQGNHFKDSCGSSEQPTTHHQNCLERINRLERLVKRNERVLKSMRTQHKEEKKNWKQQMQRLEEDVGITDAIITLFNEDQQKLLSKKYKKIPKWSNATITKALKLKFSCGNTGYTELLNQGYPLPSLRILTRKLESLKFEPGMVDAIFDFLSVKVSQFEKETDKDFMLVLDEMCITPGMIHDNSTNKFLGYSTRS